MNKKQKTLILSTALLLMASTLLGMGVMPVQATSWHAMTDSERNQWILYGAQNQIGSYGGQCKVWVQNLVYSVSDSEVWLPQNYYNPNSYYHLAQWYYSSDVQSVCCAHGYFSSPPDCPNICSYSWLLEPGQIVQMRHDCGECGTPHTMIIKSINSWGATVIDSNWCSDGYVREHYISSSWFYYYLSAWTVYQVK